MKSLHVLYIAFISVVASKACPTITSHARCETCAMGEYELLTSVVVPCGCPKTVPTSVVTHGCDEDCPETDWASTNYNTLYATTCTSTTLVTVATSAPEATSDPVVTNA